MKILFQVITSELLGKHRLDFLDVYLNSFEKNIIGSDIDFKLMIWDGSNADQSSIPDLIEKYQLNRDQIDVIQPRDLGITEQAEKLTSENDPNSRYHGFVIDACTDYIRKTDQWRDFDLYLESDSDVVFRNDAVVLLKKMYDVSNIYSANFWGRCAHYTLAYETIENGYLKKYRVFHPKTPMTENLDPNRDGKFELMNKRKLEDNEDVDLNTCFFLLPRYDSDFHVRDRGFMQLRYDLTWDSSYPSKREKDLETFNEMIKDAPFDYPDPTIDTGGAIFFHLNFENEISDCISERVVKHHITRKEKPIIHNGKSIFHDQSISEWVKNIEPHVNIETLREYL